MKKHVLTLLAVAVVAIIISTGCAGPAEPTTPTTPTAPTAPTEPTTPTTPTEPTTPELRGSGPMKGVAQKPDGTPYKFAHVPYTLGTDYMATVDGVVTTLIERAGGEVTTYDPNADMATQIATLENLLTMGIDGIIMFPVDSAGLVPTVEKIWDEGVPVVMACVDANTDKKLSCVQTDNRDAATHGAEYLVQLAEDTDTHLYIYEIWGEMAHEVSMQRHLGYHDIFDAHPDLVTVMESPDTNWSTDLAMQFTIEAFTAHPELNAVCSHNNHIAGVCEAFNTMGVANPVGHPDHVPYVGLDCYPVAMNFLRDGLCDGIGQQSCWENADGAAKAMLLSVCCGQEVPSSVKYKSYLVTIENCDSPRWGAPYTWGDMWNNNIDYDDWPILELPEEYGLPIPTVDMK